MTKPGTQPYLESKFFHWLKWILGPLACLILAYWAGQIIQREVPISALWVYLLTFSFVAVVYSLLRILEGFCSRRYWNNHFLSMLFEFVGDKSLWFVVGFTFLFSYWAIQGFLAVGPRLELLQVQLVTLIFSIGFGCLLFLRFRLFHKTPS